MSWLVKLGYFIPKNLVSYIFGWFFRIRLPGFLNILACKIFIKLTGIDMSEAEFDVAGYSSIEDLFTRRLKPGLRPTNGEVISPADGKLVYSAQVSNKMAIQAKGLNYSVEELVFGKDGVVETSDLSHAMTIYLAPHNYHRVHSPVDGTLESISYFPGELWPVNKHAVRVIPNLFVRNERLVFKISLKEGGIMYLVMVGALNVGRIQPIMVPSFVTNDLPRLKFSEPKKLHFEKPYELMVGSELGVFSLGSTVVLVSDSTVDKRFNFLEVTEGDDPIQLGEPLIKT